MALTYLNFQNYPIQIAGLDDTDNEEIQAIESFVLSDIAYSGEEEDLSEIVPFFVFYRFCEDRDVAVMAQTGESKTSKDLAVTSVEKQRKAWNIGVSKLNALCELKLFLLP